MLAIPLKSNQISHIESNALLNLTKLALLNISSNPLVNLPNYVINGSNLVKILLIDSNFTFNLEVEVFHNVEIKHIITHDYRLCCLSPPGSVCPAKTPWHKSCLFLLQNYQITSCFVSVSGLIFGVSLLSIVANFMTGQFNKSFSAIYIPFLLTNMLLSAYLGVLSAADIAFKSIFVTKENQWRSGSSCFVAYFLAAWFAVLNQVLFGIFTLARLMVVVKPLDTEFKRTHYVVKMVAQVCLTTLIVIFSLTLVLKFTKGELGFSLCFPFVDPSNSILQVKLGVWFLFGTEVTSLVLLIVMHASLVDSLLKSQKIIGKSKDSKDSNRGLIFQLVAITTSTILCWAPSSIIYITAYFQSIYSIDLINWTIVLITPINSVFIPIILLGTSLRAWCCAKV